MRWTILLWVCVFLIFWNMGGLAQNVQEVDDVPSQFTSVLVDCGVLSFPSVSHNIGFVLDGAYSPEDGYSFSAELEVLRNGSITFYKQWYWDLPSIQRKI